ncbi:dmX-like protein 1 isoform X1 [Gopherus flavomarginatus]|uniref:dmX-like protein 1 isoform X1 n=1 Tax=Gopherus flavomarginatus TaxID=286002 RepID=UPI0021CC3AC7|nr:dmX-like protein 1 isoform X1 [Gopherus flavomarginatus]
MNLHQVLTGAVNPGDNCFSVGSLQDQPLTAYASGCDIVILGTDFERLQIIPGAKHGNIQVGCVDCSMQQGKIAASYGNMICIFEPVTVLKQKSNHPAGMYYQWQKSGQILLDSIAHNITWDPTGTRLLTGSNCLQLWSNVNLENQSEDGNPERTDVSFGDWRCMWQCKTASQVYLMKFSPDGEFFATAGKDDCLVKVWYNTDSWRSAVTPQSSSPQKQAQEVDFSFVYLAHPRSVNGFSWRKTSKYMPRGAVCNVLLTCCKDNVCRLWAETLLPNDSLSCAGGYNHWTEPVNLTNNFKRNASSKERMQNALELNLRPFRRGRRRSLALIAHTGYSPHQQDPHEVHRNTPLHANALCHFHIAASINPATDIPLLPSITSLSLSENEEKSGPFVVHWLNNKELHFTLSVEVFLQHLKKSFEQHSSETSTEESNQLDGKSDEEAADSGEEQKGNQEKKETIPNSGFVPLSSAIIDHEIEILLSEWSKNADMLFSIHPMDGSLLVWHVDWLDEYQPGMFRQVQVSFVSRIPVAFPTGDANSLCRSIVMYACTKNVDLAIQQGKQKPLGLTRSSSMLISSAHNKSTNSLKLSIFTPNVMMISKHEDGSLNQWLVSFAEESAFSTVLSISHKSRYCGHRFHLNDLACHSVLPLLLTTSHHNALRSPDVDSTKQTNDTSNSGESPLRSQNRDTTSVTSQDPNAVYSELILWRVDPVGPLSFSGGVSELARINSLHVSAFSNVAWLPTLIPSYCLGAYCNSPSACFVASDGQYLRLYQAVIDAKKLLCELSNPEISKYVGEVFNIISQQSTARPGCIVELDAITELHGSKTQLLHVFQEDFILNNNEEKIPVKNNCLSDSGNLQNGFSEKFYLIVIEYTQNRSLLHMWNLHLKSIPVSVDEKIDSNIDEAVSHHEELYSSSLDPEKIQSPFTQKYRACRANLQSTSRLTLSSEMVYSQELNLPEGVEIISVKPSAGHLSSSSVYPVCHAPYLLATSCSDGKVRFWRCRVNPEAVISSMPEYTVNSNVTYIWEEWPLLVEDGLLSSSTVNVPGRPIEVSCAHTNRLAVAYKQMTSKNSRCSQDFMMHVSIFECESTGGSCWILEQTLHLDEISIMLDSAISIDSNLMAYNKQEVYLSNNERILPSTKHLVHLDWMSKEDGSHILTVGIGSKLYMFGQLVGNMHDQSSKEMSALPLWENAKVTSFCRFVLLRCVDLVSSVEGSPPLPVSLSWVRDGILVVGMDCEMHVYSQWQSPSKQESVMSDSYSGSTPSITSLMKQSQSAGSGLHPPKRTLTRSMTSLAQKLSGKRTAFDLSVEMEDSGLFEAAHALCPTLPQYHPFQLLELMDLGKVRRAKAILSHLVKCIAGEVVAINESEPNHDRRLRSLTISASGSTARDPKTFNKTENTDYTEIDSVPPLPLYALLAADDDCSHFCLEKSNNQNNLNKQNGLPDENYEDLFQNSSLNTDDLTVFEADEDNTKPKIIDLSQYSPTYFGPEHAQVLSRHLLHSSLPGLTRMEQMSLMALADTIATTSTDIGESRDRNQGGETLDECGLKFLLAVQLHTFLTTSLPPVYRAQLLHQGLSTRHFAWAFHSVAEEELLNMLPAVQKGDPTWSELRAMGVGWWVRNIHSLRRCIEKVAKAAFQRNNDPLDAAIFYLAMKKKAVIWGLYRSQKETKMTQFFGNNFTEDRWRKAALKNAFSLLGKQRFEHSAAFFLLAGHLKDAVEVCLEKLGDIQLALVISRLYESEFEASSMYKSILQKRILGSAFPGKESSSNMHCDPFLRSMAFWILEDYSRALDTLIKQPAGNEEDENGASPSCDPSVFNFYNYLRTHPLLLRRHFGSSETSSTRICLTVENGLADKINLSERRLFFTTAHAHLKAGCPMLALEVLSKMPKVVKKSKPFCSNSSLMDTNKDFSPSSPIRSETKEDKVSIVDWAQHVLNGLGSLSDCSSDKQSSSALSFDWSQPSLVFQDEPLELKWESDKDEDSEDSSLVMKELKPLQKMTSEKLDETSSNYSESFSALDENYLLSPSEDVISAQLKFRACLKILTVELRTLSTGYEVDGGKLRYQLYHWLEREVVALQKTCDYSAEVEEVQAGISVTVDEIALSENTEELSDESKAMLQRENFQKRRQWLLKYQSLLRMFLSYCILHGSHGGGLASVRMELILLLQESQQEQSIQTLPSPLPEQNSIPLLFACTASAKTVVASPLLHLSNLTHDILHAVINLDSPPHPDIQNNKIHVMHTLAASLSACIYQCLCGGHSYSSLQANQFTGTVYQTLLLTQRHTLRTTSLDETVTPNTSPAQWPGITALIRLLNSAGEEAQPGLSVLLCEILTAVYLSLFIHGLATHSSSELYRIMAHPFNDKMWSAVFGGGAHIPSRGQMQQTTKAGRHFSMPSPHQVVVFSMECVGFSKSLTAISTHSPTKHAVSSSVDNGKKQQKSFTLSSKISPKESSQSASSSLVEQESPSYREKFIPPELSIWDYFIAKPFLPTSQSRVEYDSEESQGSDDEDEDFTSDLHLQEHSNSNSYSWSLMRLAMVQLVLHRLKNFYPLAGHDLSELPVSSPLCHAILKTFQRWEQVLLRRLEIHGGPPQNLISAHTSEDALSAGPALLRHKALLEPTNTPFKSNSHVALSVKRLWQYLVKQEEVQETFIRNIFTKKRCLNESLEDHSETIKNTMMEEPFFNKIEADLGYPGGKARIIHKESDIITAFAVNKANRNCIAIASSHDIQELDVSGILATQIYTWVDDDTEVEAKGSDDFLVIHARDDLANVQGTTPYTHSNPGTPINMPWLGSTQTGRGASVLIKKAINNVRRMASHPTLPYYLTGAQDGSVRMFEWGHSQQITCFRSGGNSRITRMRFNHQGNKFGIVDADGYICLYQTNWKCCPLTGSTPKPYLTWQCHNKTANDFVFISSSSLIATAGQATDNRNICLWDTLVAPANSLVHAFICHDSGATVLAYAPKHQLLISGGRKGFTCILDLRQKQQRQLFQSHDSPVKAIAVDPAEEYFVTGSAEGNIKVWSLSTFNLLHTFINEHARQSIFRNIGTGVMQIETGPANHIFSCGADGTVKMRILPDQFSPVNEVLKNEVKFML